MKIKVHYTCDTASGPITIYGKINGNTVITETHIPGLFHFMIPRTFNEGIGMEDLTIQWYTVSGSKKEDFIVSSSHRFYYLLDTPNPPWNYGKTREEEQINSIIQSCQSREFDHTFLAKVKNFYAGKNNSPVDKENSSLTHPRTDVLDIVCDWAGGARDEKTIISSIIDRVAWLGKKKILCYSPNSYFTNSQYKTFHCSKITDDLSSLSDETGKDHFSVYEKKILVNCEDCASLVWSFANITGCNTKIIKIRSDFHGRSLFNLAHYRMIGQDDLIHPLPEKSNEFIIHEVVCNLDPSSRGNSPVPGLVWDASMKIKTTKGFIPVKGIPFGGKEKMHFSRLFHPGALKKLIVEEIRRFLL